MAETLFSDVRVKFCLKELRFHVFPVCTDLGSVRKAFHNQIVCTPFTPSANVLTATIKARGMLHSVKR